MKQKNIILVDGNNFFASCEQMVNPALKNKPLCVLSNNDGCVIARSNEAKKLGVRMGMPYFMAKKEFPQVVYVSSDFSLYHDISQRMMQILSKYSDLLDIYSIDEAFLDVTGTDKIFNMSYFDLIKEIKTDVEKKLGITVSIGLAPSVILAKTANHIAKKSSGLYEIKPDCIEKELINIPVEDLWSVGRNIARKLRSKGIFFANQVLSKPDEFYRLLLGKKGLELKYELSGQSVIPITGIAQKPKSIQRTRAFPEFSSDKEYIKTELFMHLHNVCKKLRENSLSAGAISVMLRTKDFRVVYFGNSQISETNSELYLTSKVNELFDEIYQKGIIYRSAGIWAYNLIDTEKVQLSLFKDETNIKSEKISSILDKVEDKFGKGTIAVGKTGIKEIIKQHSREKRLKPF